MKIQTLVKKYLPQNPDIEVLVPNYKEPILPVNHGGFGWYGLQAYDEQGQLMCHECGIFVDALRAHIHKHNLNGKEYRLKYGLLQSSPLTSKKARRNASIAQKNRADWHDFTRKGAERLKLMRDSHTNHHSKMAIELQNRYDTCPQQLLRWLYDLSGIYGPNITVHDIERERPSLVTLLHRQFGSFNKAKQMLKLSTNDKNAKLVEHLILEDMVTFFNNYKNWPMKSDYKRGLMLCSYTTIQRNRGLKAFRQEAMKLREEQEARRIKGEQIVQYANNIEMELAGTARR